MKAGVIAIILNSSKTAVLAVKRRDIPMWVLPGGGLEPGEDPKEAVIREAYEESGLKVKIIRQVGEYWPKSHLASHTYTFECSSIDGELKTGDETLAINFFPLNALPRNFFHIHHEWLIDALENSQTVIRKAINVTYWELIKYFLRHPIIVIRAILTRNGMPINKKNIH